MPPDAWVKLLYTYGPFGLLVLFVFVIEGRARRAWTAAQPKAKPVYAVVYCGTWLAIFGLALSIVFIWQRVHLPSEVAIRGRFENLEGSDSVFSRSEDLYLRRVYAERDRFDIVWRVISRTRLPDGTRIRFFFDRSTCQSERSTVHELVVRSAFYDAEVQIRYDRARDALYLVNAGELQELPAVLAREERAPAPRPPFSFGMAYAGELRSSGASTKQLESADPILRRSAREALAREGFANLQWADETLASPASSYRLRLGALSVLNGLPRGGEIALSGASLTALADAAGSDDETIRREAIRYLVAHPSSDAVAALERLRADNSANRAPDAAQKTARLAVAELETLYNLGVLEKDRYGSGRPQDRPRLDAALDAFRRAWGLRGLVAPDDRVVFAKALYGWGLALHDRSWLDRDATGRKPVLVEAAKQKFREFLEAARNPGRGTAYPFPEHLLRAESYLSDPSPKSLLLTSPRAAVPSPGTVGKK